MRILGGWFEITLLAMVAFMVAFGVVAAVHYSRSASGFDARCRAAHGYPFRARGGSVCLRRDAVIPIPGGRNE